MDNVLIVIPARLASTRLPNKPLADIGGRPMIVRVWERAIAAGAGRVVVAAAEEEIAAAVRAAGGEAVLTDPALPSGSDRVWAAVQALDSKAEIIVNLQGDLPTMPPVLIPRALAALKQSGADIATLAAPIVEAAELHNPNVVKIALAGNFSDSTTSETIPSENAGAGARALYFSRAAIPTGDAPKYHHIGIYAYRRAALARFVALPPSPLERSERLEQLRALEAGMIIAVGFAEAVPPGVDTPEDLAQARLLYQQEQEG